MKIEAIIQMTIPLEVSKERFESKQKEIETMFKESIEQAFGEVDYEFVLGLKEDE